MTTVDSIKVGTVYKRKSDGRLYLIVAIARVKNENNFYNKFTIVVKPKHGDYPSYSHKLEDFRKNFILESKEVHYYIYFVRNGQLHYERTTATEERAEERCKELKKWKDVTDAFFTINKSIKGAFV